VVHGFKPPPNHSRNLVCGIEIGYGSTKVRFGYNSASLASVVPTEQKKMMLGIAS
jgi:hypothetical protein